jgi:starch synthase
MTKILFVTSEAHPLIKTGGLGDVSGSLPAALKAQHCTLRLMLPAYPEAKSKLGELKRIAALRIPGTPGEIVLLEGEIPESKITVWLVDYAPAFAREGNPYQGPDGHDWTDNAERFALFARAVCAVALGRAGLRWVPDVVHCNDWQSGLVPALLSLEATRPATVFTIHNLSYQGLFPAETFRELGLPAALWSHHGLEFHGRLSFIKGGIAYADRITTVSPGYAREIQTPEFGCGLEGLLHHRRGALRGILNGIDNKEWNPAADPHLVKRYDAKHLKNKAANKAALLEEFGLPPLDGYLLLGSVGRLVEQKGVDLILDLIKGLHRLPVQLVMLGSGAKHLEDAMLRAAKKHPEQISVKIGYNEGLAHRVEAGSDAFLMPSRFEPCGLNQLYSLRYGTLPIVHAVGGLADTVTDSNVQTLQENTATGFCFRQPTLEALQDTLERVLELYSRPDDWSAVMKNAMAQNFDWHASAGQYIQLYGEMLAKRQ